jgi:hypothetical protein
MKHYQIENEIARIQNSNHANKECVIEKLKLCLDALQSIVDVDAETSTHAVFIARETLAKIK